MAGRRECSAPQQGTQHGSIPTLLGHVGLLQAAGLLSSAKEAQPSLPAPLPSSSLQPGPSLTPELRAGNPEWGWHQEDGVGGGLGAAGAGGVLQYGKGHLQAHVGILGQCGGPTAGLGESGARGWILSGAWAGHSDGTSLPCRCGPFHIKEGLEQKPHLLLFPCCRMEQRTPSQPQEAWSERPRALRTPRAQQGPDEVYEVQPLQGLSDSGEGPSASDMSPQQEDPLSCIRACCMCRPQVVGTLCFPGCPCLAVPRGSGVPRCQHLSLPSLSQAEAQKLSFLASICTICEAALEDSGAHYRLCVCPLEVAQCIEVRGALQGHRWAQPSPLRGRWGAPVTGGCCNRVPGLCPPRRAHCLIPSRITMPSGAAAGGARRAPGHGAAAAGHERHRRHEVRPQPSFGQCGGTAPSWGP